MKKFFLAVVFLLMIVSLASATPPRDLQLQYDPVAQILQISMKHPTVELREHYIRTINVAVNQQEPKVYRFGFQRSSSEVITTVSLELKAGDTVSVKAICSQGGSAEAELLIPLVETKEVK